VATGLKKTYVSKAYSSKQLSLLRLDSGGDQLLLQWEMYLLPPHRIQEELANAGIAQTVISSLSLAVNSAMEAESILASGKAEFLELKNRLFEVRKEAENLGTEVHFHIVSPFMDEFQCGENIARAIVVGSGGGVSPCVMAQVPVEGENFYYFRGQRRKLRNLNFGNIANEPLKTIWHRKEYKRFVRTFLRGEAPAFCLNCQKKFIDDFEQNAVSEYGLQTSLRKL
jgi:MoaA/NifB/PqqE/SkfB family radical SAM enzyme